MTDHRCSISLLLFPDDVDCYRNGFGGHAHGVVAGLEVQLGLDQVVAGGSHNLGLDDELVGVDAELVCGRCWEGEVLALRVSCVGELDAGPVGNRERCRDEVLIAGRMRVDVEALGDAEMQGYFGGFTCGDCDLLGVFELYRCASENGVARRIGLTPSRGDGERSERGGNADPLLRSSHVRSLGGQSPNSFCKICGTAEAMHFQNSRPTHLVVSLQAIS